MFTTKNRVRFTAAPHNGFTLAAIGFMLLSVVLRCFCPYQGLSLWVHFVLPVISGTVFIVLLLCFGRKTLAPLCLPVTGGVAFFICKAFSFPSPLHTVLCCFLYLAVLALYGLTLLGVLPSKLPLYPLIGLPLLVHIMMDIDEYLLTTPRPPLSEILPELSVLCIMAALLCLVFAMKKEPAENRVCRNMA